VELDGRNGRDRDGDGFTEAEGDCQDGPWSVGCGRAAAADIHPGADELCNGLDDDCDGTPDEDVVDPQTIGFEDADGDGHGDPSRPILGCRTTGLFGEPEISPPGDDCDDGNPAVAPFAEEFCNGLDDDCDGVVDNNGAGGWWYPDLDGDGHGDGYGPEFTCDPPAGFIEEGGDCDDAAAGVHPEAPEDCDDGLDSDCDGLDGADEPGCAGGDDDSAR
jgi:hypothetical protein